MRRPQQLSPRRVFAWLPPLAAILAVVAVAGAPSVARAGDKDPDGLVAVAEALSDLDTGKAKDGLKKVEDALKGCAGAACESGTRAQLYVALGIIQGTGLKDSKKALAAFEAALKEDPKVTPDAQFMTAGLKKLFSEAQKNAKRAATSGGTRPPPSKEQMAGVNAATAQLNGKDWSSCMGTILAVMGENEFAAGKLILAQCEDAGGLLLEATGDAKLALKYAEEEANADLKKKAADLVARLANDTPTIVVQMPKTVDDAVLTVDGVVVPADKVDKPILHNPGKATIEVKGKKGTFPYEFKSTESFDRGERITVNADNGGGANTSAIQQCLASARNASDLNRCIESGGKGRGLTLHGGLEVASYNDNTSVDVLAPTLFFSAENPTAGWQVAATYGVDVVSNASPDIVATASKRFDEVRHSGTLAGELKIGPTRAGLNGGVSIEPDYKAYGVGASVSADLYNKQITPTLSYHFGYDVMGRCGAAGTSMPCTPSSVFSRNILTHAIDLSSSIITSPSTVFLVAGTIELMSGDTSKPYRYIPMFSSTIAPQLPRGASAKLVDSERLAPAPLEQVPDSRDRFAVLGRVSHRFEKATIRADERLYLDTWGLKASTTDARYFYDLTKTLRVGPHARFHIQNGVDFWERAYVATPGSAGWTLPKLRTLDRELSPLFSATLGGGLRWQAADIFSINLVAEGTYTQFLDTIYVYDRWAFFSATTLELGFE